MIGSATPRVYRRTVAYGGNMTAVPTLLGELAALARG